MGTAGPDTFVTDLSALLADPSTGSGTGEEPATGGEGAVKLHFYTFGGLLATADWADEYTRARS